LWANSLFASEAEGYRFDPCRFRNIQATEGCPPYISHWWPPGHAIGYENTFVNVCADFFQAIAEDRQSELGFNVGLENQKVLEAVTKSVAAERRIEVD
jgi:predicted dehydrogenase